MDIMAADLIHLSAKPTPSILGCCPFSGGGYVVASSFIVAHIVCGGSC